jgi:hypothetical protein
MHLNVNGHDVYRKFTAIALEVDECKKWKKRKEYVRSISLEKHLAFN